MKKRVIALALCLVMLLTCLGMSGDMIDSLVSDPAETPAPVVETTVPADAEPVETEPVQTEPAQTEPVTPDPEQSLYDRLMSCATAEEFEALVEAASEAELSSLTAAQVSDLENHMSVLNGGSAEAHPVGPQNVVKSSTVAPLVENKDTKAENGSAKAKAKQLKVSAANTPTDEGHKGLFLNKNVTDNGNGTYKISLESFVTGNVSVSTETKALPADIVLVLDVSGSMGDYIEVGHRDDVSALDTKYGAAEGVYQIDKVIHLRDMRYQDGKWQYLFWDKWTDLDDGWFNYKIKIKKLDALKIATKNFVDQVSVKAQEDSVDHKISIVKFAGDSIAVIGNDTNMSGYNYSQIVTKDTDITDAESLHKAIDGLTAAGATAADYGMTHADTIINGITRESNKVVIMFTDGEPNHANGFDNDVANAAIATSKSIKDTGATVYTIGIFDGADDTVPMKDNANDVNKYMHYVSSNFKNATSLTNPGQPTYPSGDNESYYIATASAVDISNVFQTISSQITTGGASRILSESAVMKDTVTQYFNMPDNPSDIKVYTADYLGYESDGTTRKFAENKPYTDAQVEVNGQTVSVTNFNYSSEENCVTDTTNNGKTTYSGKKFIVEFNITPNNEFFGGNNVPTNETTSGIYEKANDNTPIGAFVVPTVDVPIKVVEVTAEDKNVYYGNPKLTPDDLSKDAKVKCGGIEWDEADAWQKEFVTLKKTANFGELNTTYTVTATVTPNDNGTATEKTGTDTAAIKIFYPEITFKDSEIELGKTPEYEDNLVSVAWKHGETYSNSVTMTGDPPMLTYEYKPPEEAFKTDTYVNVEVFVGTEKKKLLDNEVSFTHCDCKYNDCKFDPNQGEFIVHIKTFDLTITKEITGNYGTQYGNRDFIFNVKCEKNKIDMNVVVTVDKDKGSGSVTIKGLPVGTYTITEDISWSWRYELKSVTINGNQETANENPVEYTPESGMKNNIVFTNQLENTKWLSFVDRVKNFYGMGNKP